MRGGGGGVRSDKSLAASLNLLFISFDGKSNKSVVFYCAVFRNIFISFFFFSKSIFKIFLLILSSHCFPFTYLTIIPLVNKLRPNSRMCI